MRLFYDAGKTKSKNILFGFNANRGSLVMNILSLTKNTHLFNERLNFFRFINNKYDLSDNYGVELALEHFALRLKFRSNQNLETSIILQNILKTGPSESVFF